MMQTSLADNLIKPGLVATLYGDPPTLTGLAVDLAQRHDLAAGDGRQHLWRSVEGALWLQVFTPPTTDEPDTGLLQIAYNPPVTAAGAGWAAGRARLEAILPEAVLTSTGGYTLLYLAEQTAAQPGADGEPAALAEARPLHSDRRAYPLRRAELADGVLWLTRLPERAEGRPVVVYAAVARPGREAALNAWLLGRAAPFLMPNVTAHKGYVWRQRYDGDADLREAETVIAQLAADTTEILDHLEDEQRAATQLEAMARQYDRVVGLTPRLDTIRYNLVKQQINFAQWTADLEGAPIFALHHSHLRMAVTELELLLTRARDTLQAAGTTVDLVQARLAKARVQQERRTEQLLTAVGLALALPELINATVAGAFLTWLSRWLPILAAPVGGYGMGALFWTQVALILVVGAIFLVVARYFLWRR